ncbi:leucine-rich repeat-containing protein 15-like protein [Lates japonicus]|uniref:Leucine-rich repeat-containing protein 15-like protein n=1 Tax=Lates japonicus TaxID=270547 RepID=A0AAD3MEZ1_LATJO|nr:leucine-rich repeat-containing protein 15-like protein [Lates japonicus]
MLEALTLASLILLVWASDLCPPACQCLHNLTSITCQEKGLDLIPELPQDAEKLYISYNKIQEIPRRGLEKLRLDSNQISDLPEGVFDSLSSLNELQLSYNCILELHPALFTKLKSLQNLYLEHNALSHLPKGLFHRMNDLREAFVTEQQPE